MQVSIVLRRRGESDEDLADNYPIAFISVKSLGYEGSGEDIRGFDLPKLIAEVAAIDAGALGSEKVESGYQWSAFAIKSKAIASDKTGRLDVRYWHPTTRIAVEKASHITGVKTIKELNTIETRRGDSPPPAEYVSASEGYALVVKAGSNTSKTGELVIGGDYIERSLYEEYAGRGLTLQDGDVVLASTGDGTLGKCCVYRNRDEKGNSLPGIPEGHVTVIRLDQSQIYPEYLCDYLRKGFGRDQINRVFTGSTGMIEITPDDVNGILVPLLPDLKQQEQLSQTLRKSENEASEIAAQSAKLLERGEAEFREATKPVAA